MTTAQSTMTEFTFAPGETDVVGNPIQSECIVVLAQN